MTTTTITNDTDLSTLFGFEGFSEEEKAQFLDDVGEVIVESAILRMLTELDETEGVRFDDLLADEGETSFETLLTEFPRFGAILEEEMLAFKKEAHAVLS